MAKVNPPTTPPVSATPPAPRPPIRLQPITPAAKGKPQVGDIELDPRGAEPQLADFADDLAYGIAYGMWKKGVPYEEWSAYKRGGEKESPASLKKIIQKSPSTLKSMPWETAKLIPGAAVGFTQFVWGLGPGPALGGKSAADMMVDSIKATPETLNRAVEKLEEGKYPAAEITEVAGNVALATGIGAAAARGRLASIPKRVQAASDAAASARLSALDARAAFDEGLADKARKQATRAQAKAARIEASAARLQPVAEQLQKITDVANRIADAPIVWPTKGASKAWQYFVESRRGRAENLRARANAEAAAAGAETPQAARDRRIADDIESRYGKVVLDVDGQPIRDAEGKPIITSNASLTRLMNRVKRVGERNQPAIVRDIMDLKNNEAYGPLTDVEIEAIFAESNGRAQLIAEIARRTGEAPGEIAYKMRPQKSESGRYLSRQGAELAVALINGTLDAATTQRLMSASTRLKQIVESRTRVKRQASLYKEGAGYGRKAPLDPAMEVPTPKPEWLIEALEAEGSDKSLALADEIRQQFQDPASGEFIYDPQGAETMLFIMDIMQDVPDSVAFNAKIYPGKERSNIIAYLSYLRANEALAGFTVQGAPPGDKTGPAGARPLSESPETGIPPEEIYGDALAPGSLMRMPRKFIVGSIQELNKLQGRARRLGEQLADIQMKIDTYELRIIQLNLELDALNGWYEDANGNVVRIVPGQAVPQGIEYRPGFIQQARTRVIALRAAVQKMNDEQSDVTTINDTTVTRAEAENKLTIAESQLADFEASARNLDGQIDALDDGITRLTDRSTDVESEMIGEGVDPDPLLDAIDKDMVDLPRDPFGASTARTVALPASMIAEAPWIQSEFQGVEIQRDGLAYYEYTLTPDDLLRIQNQIEGQVNYYGQKPQVGDTPQRLKNLRSGLKTINSNLPETGPTYQPTTLSEAIPPETARQKQAQLDVDHRAAYDEMSTLLDEADALADLAEAEQFVYNLLERNTLPIPESVNEILPPRAVQDAMRNVWADAYDFIDMTLGMDEGGRPRSRLLVGIVETSKRRDARGRVVADKQGTAIPGLFDAINKMGSLQRLRKRKAPYVGFGKSVNDPGANRAVGSSGGSPFTAIDVAMAQVNENGRFGQFDDPAAFMEVFVEMADVYDTLNSFVTTGRLPKQVYAAQLKTTPIVVDGVETMTFGDYLDARRDPTAVADLVRKENDNMFNQLYDTLADVTRRDAEFPQLAQIDRDVVIDMLNRAGNGQPPTALTRLQELEPAIVNAQTRIDDIGRQLAAVEEAIALEPAPDATGRLNPDTETAFARAAEVGQLLPVGKYAEGGPSALRKADWVKETADQYSIDTGTRRFRLNKVGGEWVLKRIASDGKVLDASAQTFSSFPAARRYVQEGIDFDKTIPNLRATPRPGRELGPGDQTARLRTPDSELVQAERRLAQTERRAVQVARLAQERTSRLDKMRVEEARLRAELPIVTEAAVRLEARLGQEVVTQPDVTVAGDLGQPTGRLFVGQRQGAPAVAQPLIEGGVPVVAGSPVGGLLRPETEQVRTTRRLNEATGSTEFEVRRAERAANRALLARTQNLPPTLPLEVAYAIGESEIGPYIGSTYFPATYKPTQAPGVRRGFEEGLIGEIVIGTEKPKSGTGMDIWSVEQLVKELVREQRAMDLVEGFRLLLSSKFAVTPRLILGDAVINEILADANQLAVLDPDLNPQYPGAVAAYPLGNPNREQIFIAARDRIIGEMVVKRMADLGYETLALKGSIDDPVNFEEIGPDRPFLPVYTREKVRARYPDFDARPLPRLVEMYLRGVTKGTSAFKQLTLPLSPRWQLGDMIGMVIAAGVSGVTPPEFFNAVAQAAKDNYGRFREVFADPTNKKYFKYDRRVSARGRLQAQSGLQQIGLRGEETAFLKGQQLGEQRKGLIASTPILGPIVEGYQKSVVKGAFRINEAINTIGRHAMANVHFDRLLKERGLTLDDIPEGGADMLEPAVREALYDAADIANEFMGDYMDMTPGEKKWVLPHVTFYAWIKHIHKLFAKLAKENPAAIRWHLYLGALAFEEDGDPMSLVSGSILIPGYGYVDLNWANMFSDITRGPIGALVGALSAGKPVFPENPLRPALSAISPVPRIAVAGAGFNLAKPDVISRPAGTGMVTSTGGSTWTPLFLRPGELTSFALQQFPAAVRVLDMLPQGEIPLLGLGTGPVRRYDTGDTRTRYGTTKPDIKGTGLLGWRGAASRLLTLPFLPTMTEEEKQQFERVGRQRLQAFELEQRRAEALSD